jgi:flavin reductase (DIM6/NTAB) family NADH-FMN oxidoreductase RutF
MSSLIKRASLAVDEKRAVSSYSGQPNDKISFRLMSSDPHVDSTEFKRACGHFATGVAIASVRDASGTPHGLTVNSFTSVSLLPPLILISVGHEASVIGYFRKATHFGISVLAEDQRTLSDHFARKGHDRFDGVAWHEGALGVPLLDGALASMECSVFRQVPAGDHDLFLGEMRHARVRSGRPLIYYASRYRALA